jgi:hypothetical protein
MSRTPRNSEPEHQRDHLRDCDELDRTALRQRYLPEYRSWSNMKTRCKNERGKIDPAFEDFIDFLRHMGPRPPGTNSVDRKDHFNPLYGPGLCEWSDPKRQAINRSTTRYFEVEGERIPLTELARRRGEKPEKLRKQLQRGWTEAEVVSGKRGERDRSKQWPGAQEPQRLAAFERLYRERLLSREGDTRAEFYIARTRSLVGECRQLVANKEQMLAYLEGGLLPNGATSIDMEHAWDAVDRPDAATIKRSMALDYAFIAEAESLISEADALRPTSTWSRLGDD